MATVLLPVLKPLTYQGRSYVRGQLIGVSAVDALAMARRGEVTLARDAVVHPGAVLGALDVMANVSVPRRRGRPRKQPAEPIEP